MERRLDCVVSDNVLFVTQSRRKGIGKACEACLAERGNEPFPLTFGLAKLVPKVPLGFAFERSDFANLSG